MRLTLGLLIVLCIACQPKNNSTKGKYIETIVKDKILFEDGSELQLANCENCKTIYLVRHAEKDTSSGKNPILTEQGYERSYKLAQMMKSTRLDAVYSTFYNRTMHTVDSLTTLKGMGTKVYQPKEMKTLSASLLTESELSKVLISGHSNSTPAFASTLMGERKFDTAFDESDYDNLLVVNVDEHGEKHLYQLKYHH